MVKKPRYEKNVASSTPWAPKTTKIVTEYNRSGQSHNIISHEPNMHSGALSASLKLESTGRHNKLKGITEIRDLLHISKANANVDHGQAMAQENKVFARKDGMFTHLYNSSKRFGEDKVFKS